MRSHWGRARTAARRLRQGHIGTCSEACTATRPWGDEASATVTERAVSAQPGDRAVETWRMNANDRAPAATPAAQPDTPTTDQARGATGGIRPLPAELEAAMQRVLCRPPTAQETHRECAEHREHELRELLVQLTPIEAFELGRRLDADRDGDALAVAFRRLVRERRQRLRTFLAALLRVRHS